MDTLTRRGFELGFTSKHQPLVKHPTTTKWTAGYPVLLNKSCINELASYRQAMQQTEQLVSAILDGQECEIAINQKHYSERLVANFDSLGSSINEGDDQEIETVLFDALEQNKVIAQDLWMKVSWLSFHEEDASLRFRFSFGIDHVEDVAADKQRQHYAAKLCDAIFPESAIITQNEHFLGELKSVLNCESIQFVERIVYFNSPNGGAYLHHDLERGHAGVVYAQLTGTTYWLALPQHVLVSEIQQFVEADDWPDSIQLIMQKELKALVKEPTRLSDELNSFANTTLIHLINETKEFVQQLIKHKHGYHMQAGDVLLLPQENADKCCWHSVFCIGEELGQALSFAVRTDD